MINIIGAGLAGLIAAATNPDAEVYEKGDADRVNHRAVLRFRSDKIARATGIEFRKVTVRKGIWDNGGFVPPDIRLANMYSQKVAGVVADRSIWYLDAAERWIAPENLQEQLADIVGAKRLHYGFAIDNAMLAAMIEEQRPIVSTMPLPVTLELLDKNVPMRFERSPIVVDRYRVPNCAVYQTVYYPSPNCPYYRATLTGDLLTLERTGMIDDDWYETVLDSFGVLGCAMYVEPIEANHRQEYGKIVPVDEELRKSLIYVLSTNYNVFSLGRFATWRNILLDDVYEDMQSIRKLIRSSPYLRRLASITEER